MEATLKDFDQFPEGLVVKFPEELKTGLYCELCKNISPVLFRDPDRHSFCTTCLTMATTDDIFECPCDNKEFPQSQLVEDDTIPAKLRNVLVTCPSSDGNYPVTIPFSALKAHMTGCSCKKVSPCPSCGETLHQRDIPDHIKYSCPMVICTSCSEQVPRSSLHEHETKRCRMIVPKGDPTVPAEDLHVPVSPAHIPLSKEGLGKKGQLSAVPFPVQYQESQEATARVGGRTGDPGGSPSQEISNNKESPNGSTGLKKCPFCKQHFTRHDVRDHTLKCPCRGAPHQDDRQSLSPHAERNGVPTSFPAMTIRSRAEHPQYQNSAIPQSSPLMEKRIAKIEADLHNVKQQQHKLKEELSERWDEHARSFKDEKDRMIESLTPLICQLTEIQAGGPNHSAEQVKALKEQNERLSVTVAELTEDLEMVREEVNALRIMLRTMQNQRHFAPGNGSE